MCSKRAGLLVNPQKQLLTLSNIKIVLPKMGGVQSGGSLKKESSPEFIDLDSGHPQVLELNFFFSYSFFHIFIYSYIHLFIYSFIHISIYSCIHLFILVHYNLIVNKYYKSLV